VTTSGGTGRPTTASDGRVEVDRTEDATSAAASSQGNGARSTSKASTAYEVAAALRAQASRAAQATREAATRVQSAMTTAEADGEAKPDRRDASESDGARGATHPPQAVVAPPRPAERPHPARPVPGEQQRSSPPPSSESARVNGPPVGSAPVVAPSPPAAPQAPPPTPKAPPSLPDDTQVSLDARPETPHATAHTPPPRPVQRPTSPVRRTSRVRKARLRLMRIDPWSVMKTAFLLSVALGITLFVAVAVLWSVLDAAGVFTAVGDLVRDLTQSDTSGGVDIENYTALSRVLGFTTLIAVVDVVLVTALATLGAFLYNLSASLLGGLEVTLAEDD